MNVPVGLEVLKNEDEDEMIVDVAVNVDERVDDVVSKLIGMPSVTKEGGAATAIVR